MNPLDVGRLAGEAILGIEAGTATVIAGTVTTVGVMFAASVGAWSAYRIARLERKNDLQHARADVQREEYRGDRERDHAEAMERIVELVERVQALESGLVHHIRWEEGDKYQELMADYARLIAERAESARIIREAALSGDSEVLARVADVIEGRSKPIDHRPESPSYPEDAAGE